MAPDGTVTLSIIGQVPFAFTGVLVLDPETGNIIKEPNFRGDARLAKACERLNPA